MISIITNINNQIRQFLGLTKKQEDWEKIECLVLKLAKEKKDARKYKEFWTNAREAFVLLQTPEGNIIDANPTACSLYGYPLEVIITKNILDLSAEPECTQQTYTSKTAFVPFRKHKNADGHKFLISCSLTYFQNNGDGEIAALIVRPIAEHRESNGESADRKLSVKED
jgi:PAS domain S-box-containing protein